MDNDIETIYTNITNAINFQTKNSPAFDQLIKFQLSILNDLILPSPYESSTPDFIDKFSVKVIRNILNTAVSDSSIIKTFSTILENYARIMIFIFDQPNLSFLESASHITNPSNIFYTALSSRNPPKIYTQIINLFRTKHFYEQITNFFEKTTLYY